MRSGALVQNSQADNLKRFREIAEKRMRYGYRNRKITMLLRREGRQVNVKGTSNRVVCSLSLLISCALGTVNFFWPTSSPGDASRTHLCLYRYDATVDRLPQRGAVSRSAAGAISFVQTLI